MRITSGTLRWTLTRQGGGPAIVVTAQLTNILDQFSYVLIIPAETVLAGTEPSTNAIQLSHPPTVYLRTSVTLNGTPVFLDPAALPTFSMALGDRGRLERVDLAFQQQDPDSDEDGLPNWWEQRYFPGGGAPGADADGDGVSNYREYRAGTNPTNAASLFEFIQVERAPSGGCRVMWSSVAGKTYALLRTDNLLSPATSYLPIRSGILATPPVNSFIDVTAIGAGPFFYLLKLE